MTERNLGIMRGTLIVFLGLSLLWYAHSQELILEVNGSQNLHLPCCRDIRTSKLNFRAIFPVPRDFAPVYTLRFKLFRNSYLVDEERVTISTISACSGIAPQDTIVVNFAPQDPISGTYTATVDPWFPMVLYIPSGVSDVLNILRPEDVNVSISVCFVIEDVVLFKLGYTRHSNPVLVSRFDDTISCKCELASHQLVKLPDDVAGGMGNWNTRVIEAAFKIYAYGTTKAVMGTSALPRSIILRSEEIILLSNSILIPYTPGAKEIVLHANNCERDEIQIRAGCPPPYKVWSPWQGPVVEKRGFQPPDRSSEDYIDEVASSGLEREINKKEGNELSRDSSSEERIVAVRVLDIFGRTLIWFIDPGSDPLLRVRHFLSNFVPSVYIIQVFHVDGSVEIVKVEIP